MPEGVAQQLRIVRAVWDAMIQHAFRTRPEECCGLLAGTNGVCRVLYELENEDHSPVRYCAHPRDLVRAFKDMRTRNLELLAIYHSHPTSAALPSRTDLAENYYGTLPRVIISLASHQPDVRAFVLYPDRWEEIPISVLSDERPQ